MSACSPGLDPAEQAVLEAALAQHASSPNSDGDSGRDAASVWQLQLDTDAPASQAVMPSGTAADGLDDVMEALCCPITHVRRCASAESLQQRTHAVPSHSHGFRLLQCNPANCFGKLLIPVE